MLFEAVIGWGSLDQFLSSEEKWVSLSVVMQSGDDRVVIAVDPHKASWTAAAVDGSLQPLATVRVPVSRDGYRALRRFARRWPNAGWAIEGAAGAGAFDEFAVFELRAGSDERDQVRCIHHAPT